MGLKQQGAMKTEKEKIDDPLTYKIIGCAQKVHSALGNGFQEVIYQRALAIELQKANLAFSRELEMPIYYEGVAIGTRRVDFLIEEKVLVELKALTHLEDVHLAQGLNYLVAYNVDLGLLINFGARSLEVKRLRHPKNKHQNLDSSDYRITGLTQKEEIRQSKNPANPNSDR